MTQPCNILHLFIGNRGDSVKRERDDKEIDGGQAFRVSVFSSSPINASIILNAETTEQSNWLLEIFPQKRPRMHASIEISIRSRYNGTHILTIPTIARGAAYRRSWHSRCKGFALKLPSSRLDSLSLFYGNCESTSIEISICSCLCSRIAESTRVFH